VTSETEFWLKRRHDPAMIDLEEPRERHVVGCGPLLHGDGRRKRVCHGRKVQS